VKRLKLHKVLYISILTFWGLSVYGQLGLRAHYQHISLNPWEAIAEKSSLQSEYAGSGLQIGVDYHFRLKDYRIEFFPELNYNRHLSQVVEGKSYKLQSVGLQANTHFYFLDFEEDCDCPTWSKTNDWFQKGFFVSINPGIQLVQYPETADLDSRNQWIGTFGIGAGIDFGASEWVTISPFFIWRHFFTPEWKNLKTLYQVNDGNLPENAEKRYFQQLQFGVRLGIRFYR
jgi:hypothetical protein